MKRPTIEEFQGTLKHVMHGEVAQTTHVMATIRYVNPSGFMMCLTAPRSNLQVGDKVRIITIKENIDETSD